VDKNALLNCQQNLELNFNASEINNVKVFRRDNFPFGNKYDLIFANILENILILESDLLNNSLKNTGSLIISGILKEQRENILEHFCQGNGFKAVRELNKGHWVAILFEKQL